MKRRNDARSWTDYLKDAGIVLLGLAVIAAAIMALVGIGDAFLQFLPDPPPLTQDAPDPIPPRPAP